MSSVVRNSLSSNLSLNFTFSPAISALLLLHTGHSSVFCSTMGYRDVYNLNSMRDLFDNFQSKPCQRFVRYLIKNSSVCYRHTPNLKIDCFLVIQTIADMDKNKVIIVNPVNSGTIVVPVIVNDLARDGTSSSTNTVMSFSDS